jgi:hypothetical protein
MMATGKILALSRLSIMQVSELPKKYVPDFRQINRLYTIQSSYCHVNALYESILVMVSMDINFSFYDRSSPVYTQPRYLPPSKMLDVDITDSVIGEGCAIKVNCFRICS